MLFAPECSRLAPALRAAVADSRDLEQILTRFYIARDCTVLPDDSVRAHVWVPHARQTVAGIRSVLRYVGRM